MPKPKRRSKQWERAHLNRVQRKVERTKQRRNEKRAREHYRRL